MPRYEITAPDGNRYEINAPEGATEQEALSYFQSQYAAPQDPVNPEMAEDQSIGRTIVDQGVNGALFGWGDEITDRIGAGIASVATDESYDDLLKEARGNSQDRLAAQMEQNPGTSISAGLAGALATGGAIGSTRAGASAYNGLRNGNVLGRNLGLAGRAGKGAVAGATSGTIVGAGDAADGAKSDGAIRGAELGAAIGAALPVAGASLGAVGDVLAPAADESIKQAASLAKKYGIPLGLDQVTNSKARSTIRRIANRVPFGGGDRLGEIQARTFNRAIAKSIGQDADEITEEVFDKALKDVGAQYDSIAKGRTVQFGDSYRQRVNEILDEASLVAPEGELAVLRKNADLFGTNVKGGEISGEKLNRIRSALGKSLKNAPPSVKDSIADLANVAVDALVDGAPDLASKLANTNRTYKNILAIQPLAAKASDGVISPALLKNRVIKVFGERNVAKGAAGELADLVKVADLIKPQADNSLTTEKALSLLGGPLAGATYAGGLPGLAAGAVGSAAVARGVNAVNRSQRLVDKALSKTARGEPISGVLAIPSGGAAGSMAIENNPGISVRSTVNQQDYVPMPPQSALETPEDTLTGDASIDSLDPALQNLRQDEGEVLNSYLDTKGKRTVGQGFNMDSGIAKNVWKKAGIPVSFDDVYKNKAFITPSESNRLLQASYDIAVDDAKSFFPALERLSPARQEALVNLSYQLGGPSLKDFTEFNKHLKAKKYTLAARELVKSKWWDDTQDSRKRRILQQIISG